MEGSRDFVKVSIYIVSEEHMCLFLVSQGFLEINPILVPRHTSQGNC